MQRYHVAAFRKLSGACVADMVWAISGKDATEIFERQYNNHTNPLTKITVTSPR